MCAWTCVFACLCISYVCICMFCMQVCMYMCADLFVQEGLCGQGAGRMRWLVWFACGACVVKSRHNSMIFRMLARMRIRKRTSVYAHHDTSWQFLFEYHMHVFQHMQYVQSTQMRTCDICALVRVFVSMHICMHTQLTNIHTCIHSYVHEYLV